MKKIRQKQAFTLLEILVYLASVSIFVLLSFNCLCILQKKMEILEKSCAAKVRFVLASDLIRRDLMSASMNVEDWDFPLNVFKKCTLDKNRTSISKDICWRIKPSGRLVRREGEYDYLLRLWKEKVDSTVAYNVSDLKIEIKLDQTKHIIKGILFELDCAGVTPNKDYVLTEYLSLRNRSFTVAGKGESEK